MTQQIVDQPGGIEAALAVQRGVRDACAGPDSTGGDCFTTSCVEATAAGLGRAAGKHTG